MSGRSPAICPPREMADGGQALAVGVGQVLVDAVERLLGRRQVSGRLEHEDPVGCRLERVQLGYELTLSTPALVRVSAKKTSSSSRRRAMQYAIGGS